MESPRRSPGNEPQQRSYSGRVFCEPRPFFDPPQPTGHLRQIILDFAHLNPHELLILVRSLVDENSRSGLKPLLEPNTTIYCESWYGGQGQGNRIDHVLGLYEVSRSTWLKRSSAIRIVLSALWSLVYEESTPNPARSKRQKPTFNSEPTPTVWLFDFSSSTSRT